MEEGGSWEADPGRSREQAVMLPQPSLLIPNAVLFPHPPPSVHLSAPRVYLLAVRGTRQ